MFPSLNYDTSGELLALWYLSHIDLHVFCNKYKMQGHIFPVHQAYSILEQFNWSRVNSKPYLYLNKFTGNFL